MNSRLEPCDPNPMTYLRVADGEESLSLTSPAVTSTPLPDGDANALIRRVAAGDLVAFETLYRHYTPWLMHHLQMWLEQAESAEDICQDVFLVVWNNASKFRPLAPLSTWIFEIAQQLVLKARTRDVKLAHELAASAGVETEADNPEASLCRQNHHHRVNRAVEALPPVLRQTIALRFYHEYTYREIATRMDCAEVTVKNRLRQARRRLGAALRRRETHYAMAI